MGRCYCCIAKGLTSAKGTFGVAEANSIDSGAGREVETLVTEALA
jgi:hypothetical protein